LDEHSTKCSNNRMSPSSITSSSPPLSSFLVVVAFDFLYLLLVAALPGLEDNSRTDYCIPNLPKIDNCIPNLPNIL
jgi:hypothetical protein